MAEHDFQEIRARTFATAETFSTRFPFPGRVEEGGVLTPQDDAGGDPQREHGDGKPPPFGPLLICRTFVGDGGARPLGGSGLVFWESPDIWVEAPDGSDVPEAGRVNRVKVHVWNLGQAAAYGVRVELYWCNPAVGVNLANSSAIGVQESLTFEAGEHRVLSFDWTPGFVNGGHECLVAQVYDPVSDNLAAPFNPVADRHVAQRNVNVVQAAQAQELHLEFFAANLSAGRAHSELYVQRLAGDALQTLAQGVGRAFLANAGEARVALAELERRPARPSLDLARHPEVAVFRETAEPVPQRFVRGLLEGALFDLAGAEPQAEPERTQAARARGETPLGDPCRETHPLTLEPRQEARMRLSVRLPEHSVGGRAYAYRVIETTDGQVTGGLTFLIRTPSDRPGEG